MCHIVSTLRFCGETIKEEDMLVKTFSTFHASNLVLQQQYRKREFKTYSELHTCLILVEENNQLLLHNHQNLPEANSTSYQRGRGRGQGRDCYCGRGGKGQGKGGNNTWINSNIQRNNENKPRNQINKTNLMVKTSVLNVGKLDIGLTFVVHQHML
ncbi:hypothetical protein V2J09_001972 [Rumex salicifolius]